MPAAGSQNNRLYFTYLSISGSLSLVEHLPASTFPNSQPQNSYCKSFWTLPTAIKISKIPSTRLFNTSATESVSPCLRNQDKMGKTGKRSKHLRGNRNQPRSSRNPVAPTNPWTGRGPRAQRLESPSRATRRRDERSRSPRPKAGTSQQIAPTGESSSKKFPTAPPRGPRDWRMGTQHGRAQATNGHPGSQPRETNPPAPFLRQDPNGQSLLTARRGGTHSGNHRNGTPRVNVANSSRTHLSPGMSTTHWVRRAGP